MTQAIEIDGKELLPIKEAVLQVSYSRDYVTRLAREGKIVATTIGRQWYVDLDSLKQYNQQSVAEQEIRKKRLSEERKRETEIHLAAIKQKTARDNKASTFQTRALAGTAMVLTLGLLTGVTLSTVVTTNSQLATKIEPVESIQSPQTESVELPVIDDGVQLASAQVADDRDDFISQASSTHSIAPISDAIEEGILLLPEAGLKAT